MRTLIALLLVAPIIMGCVTPSQIMLDAEVRRLCAIDGGIKVYETVKLPADSFDKWGMVKLYSEQRKEIQEIRRNDDKWIVMGWTLGAEYSMKWSIYYYRKGDPSMMKNHFEITRRADGKLLGETISYSRGGGDLPGPWQPSAFTCPLIKDAGPNALLMRTFTKE